MKFSDCAIETALTLRRIFKLPLRQPEGFLRSVLSLMARDLRRRSSPNCQSRCSTLEECDAIASTKISVRCSGSYDHEGEKNRPDPCTNAAWHPAAAAVQRDKSRAANAIALARIESVCESLRAPGAEDAFFGFLLPAGFAAAFFTAFLAAFFFLPIAFFADFFFPADFFAVFFFAVFFLATFLFADFLADFFFTDFFFAAIDPSP